MVLMGGLRGSQTLPVMVSYISTLTRFHPEKLGGQTTQKLGRWGNSLNEPFSEHAY